MCLSGQAEDGNDKIIKVNREGCNLRVNYSRMKSGFYVESTPTQAESTSNAINCNLRHQRNEQTVKALKQIK